MHCISIVKYSLSRDSAFRFRRNDEVGLLFDLPLELGAVCDESVLEVRVEQELEIDGVASPAFVRVGKVAVQAERREVKVEVQIFEARDQVVLDELVHEGRLEAHPRAVDFFRRVDCRYRGVPMCISVQSRLIVIQSSSWLFSKSSG